MSNVRELTKVERDGAFWVVKLLSAATGRWLVVGEHLSQEAALRNLRQWRAA